jgi:hypothetical protein
MSFHRGSRTISGMLMTAVSRHRRLRWQLCLLHGSGNGALWGDQLGWSGSGALWSDQLGWSIGFALWSDLLGCSDLIERIK